MPRASFFMNRFHKLGFIEYTGHLKVHSSLVCGSEACSPVPVPLRPPTDFLWQRDPFQLTGGGSSTVESLGIDYILPYWMGRYYGVISPDSVQSSAAPSVAVAPGSLATMYGSNLAAGNTPASAL